MASIFGPTGQEVFRNIQRDRAREAAALGARAGALSPTQMFGQAGSFLGLAAQQGIEAFTGQVPHAVERANRLQAAQQQVMMSGVNASDPIAFNDALAEALSSQGLLDEAAEAGRESERLQREQVEQANIESMIAARMTVKQQQREDELAREARATEGRLGRESREEIARLDRESRERIAAMRGQQGVGSRAGQRVGRAATGSDRATAEAALRERFPATGGILGIGAGAGEFDFDDLSEQDRTNMIQWSAQRARDIATANPGTLYEDAVEIAVQEAAGGVTGQGAFERAKWSPPGQQAAPATGQTAIDVQNEADRILGL